MRDLVQTGEYEEIEEEIKQRRAASKMKYVPPNKRRTRPEVQYEGEAARGIKPSLYKTTAEKMGHYPRTRLAKEFRHLLVKYALEDTDPATIPYEIRREAKELNKLVANELRDKLALVSPDDPDRTYRIHEIKIEFMQDPRRDRDREAGLTQETINIRAKDRLRIVMKRTVARGVIPAKTVKGPAEKAPDEEARKERDKRAQKKRDENRKV